MRLAVSTAAPPDLWRQLARDVESMGFDVLHLADHLVDDLPAPFAALAVAAEATERLVVGTMVLAVDFRHPAVLAREAATLAELSGGRFELGIGAGHAEAEWHTVGVPFDAPGVRVGRLTEAVVVLRRLLAGEEVTFDGEHYRLRSHRVWPVPTQPVPVLVGGNGDRVLRVAAAHADIVGFTGFGHRDGRVAITHFGSEGLANRVAFVRDAAGDRWTSIRTQALVQRVVVTGERRAAAEAIAAEAGGVDVDAILDSPFLFLGTARQIAEQFRERTERFGIDTWTILAGIPGVPTTVESLAPVIEAVRSG